MSSRTSGRKRKEPERLSDESSLEPKKKKGAGAKKASSKKTASSKKPAAKKAKTTSKKAASTKKTATPKAKKTPSKKTPSKKAASSKKKTPAKKTSKKADDDDDEEEDDDDSTPSPAPAKSPKAKAAPKAKTGSSVTEALYQLGLDELKERLRANDGLVSGSKKDLIKRIADAVTNGCPPRCPACSGGRLKKSGSTWKCPGYHNGDYFQRCSYSTTTPTLIPWKKADGKDF